VTTAARQAVTAAIGRARFTGVTGPVAFDAWGDLVHPVVAVYEVVGEEFVPVLVRRR
jgi:ABC-type branched-subunit amino acid transport system substrate-binding protein